MSYVGFGTPCEVVSPSFQEFNLLTLDTRGQSPKPAALQNAYVAILFNQGDGLPKEVWVCHEWEPKLWSRGCRLFFYKNIPKTNKILAIRLEGLYWTWNKVGYSFFLWTLGLSFGGFTLWPSKPRRCGNSWLKVWPLEASNLCPPEGSASHISLSIFSPFLWTFNKGWPFNTTTSRLRRP